jgi:hypothetical protein
LELTNCHTGCYSAAFTGDAGPSWESRIFLKKISLSRQVEALGEPTGIVVITD